MKYRFIFVGLILLVGFLVASKSDADKIMYSRFSHEVHAQKVFGKDNITCSYCHNFKLDEGTGKITPNPNLTKSIFSKPLKDICHKCHQGTAKYPQAPKSCFNCHSSVDDLKAIKPQGHENIDWKRSHSIVARADGNYCMNCHVKAQCVKCHLRRTDLEFQNHSRNYRYTHSVEARMQPHRCDFCHSRSYCVRCHLGS